MTTGIYVFNQFKKCIDPTEDFYVCWTVGILAKSVEDAAKIIREAHKDEEWKTEFYVAQNPEDPIDITQPFHMGYAPKVSVQEAWNWRNNGIENKTFFLPINHDNPQS